VRWPFRRTDPTEPAPAGEGAFEPPVALRADPAAVPAWRSMPSIQRASEAAMPLTAPTTDLVADVQARQTPLQVLAPLGHDVGSLAPVGTIGLRSGPVESRATGPELVQRQVARAHPAVPPRTVESPSAPMDVPDLPPPMAPRAVTVVDAAATPDIQRSLTSAAESLPSVQPPEGLVLAGDDRGSPLETRDVSPEMAPPASPTTVVARSTADGVGDATSGLPAVVLGDPHPRPAMPPVRRLGLGAPIASAATTPVQRLSPTPVASPVVVGSTDPGTTVVQPSPAVGDAGDSPPPGDRARRGPIVQRYSLSDGLPLARTAHADPPPTSVEGTPDLAAPPDPMAATPHGESHLQRVEATSSVPSEPARRGSGDVDPPASSGPGPGHVADPGDRIVTPSVMTGSVTVSRIATVGMPAPAMPVRSVRPVAGRAAPILSIQRAPGQVAGFAALGAPVDISRTIERSTLVGPRGELTPVPGEPGTAASGDQPATWHADGPGPGLAVAIQRQSSPVAKPAPLALATPRPGPIVATIELQRDPGLVSAAPDAPMSHAAPGADVAASSSFDSRVIARDVAEVPAEGAMLAPIQRAESAAESGVAPAPAPGGSEKDLDELARRLYDRIRLRLKRELLIDRERAGALTDLR
jgi:hypothetical protein